MLPPVERHVSWPSGTTAARRCIWRETGLRVKPLYYSRAAEGFAFASEIKAMWPTGVSRRINFEALNQYVAFRYIQTDTVLEGVHKVPAGCFLRITAGDAEPELHRYWKLDANQKVLDISSGEAGGVAQQADQSHLSARRWAIFR